jgi:hypothetical protein
LTCGHAPNAAAPASSIAAKASGQINALNIRWEATLEAASPAKD